MLLAKKKIRPVDSDCAYLDTGVQRAPEGRAPPTPNLGITGILASREIGRNLALMNCSILTYGTLLSRSKTVASPVSHARLRELKEVKTANVSELIFI